MRKKILTGLALVAFCLCFTSCASILGGKVTEAQRTKPKPGEPTRQIRVGYFIADIFLTGLIGIPIDFATCAIYKPQKK